MVDWLQHNLKVFTLLILFCCFVKYLWIDSNLFCILFSLYIKLLNHRQEQFNKILFDVEKNPNVAQFSNTFASTTVFDYWLRYRLIFNGNSLWHLSVLYFCKFITSEVCSCDEAVLQTWHISLSIEDDDCFVIGDLFIPMSWKRLLNISGIIFKLVSELIML